MSGPERGLAWQAAGQTGERLREAVQAQPGWWWVLRPQEDGARAYRPDLGVRLPVWFGPDGRVRSPLADLRDLRPESLCCTDEHRRVRYGTFFAGPVHPGPLEGQVRADPSGHPQGLVPDPGWRWCRTHAPLQHVDAQGIGPVYLRRREDTMWVYAAESVNGDAVDLWELGFAEPLTSSGGVIDASGELGRVRAEFFGPIPLPEGPAPAFPVLGGWAFQ